MPDCRRRIDISREHVSSGAAYNSSEMLSRLQRSAIRPVLRVAGEHRISSSSEELLVHRTLLEKHAVERLCFSRAKVGRSARVSLAVLTLLLIAYEYP